MIKKIFCTMLLVCMTLIGCSSTTPVNSDNVSNKKEIKIYVPDKKLLKWEVKKETVDVSDLKNVIELLKYTEKCCIPIDTEVNSIEIVNEIAYVDLSADFDDSETGSSAATTVKIYSIVNTLCLNEFFGVNGVKFLIDGEEVETIGPMDVSIIKTPKLEL